MMERPGLAWFVVIATAVTLEMVRSVGPLLDSVYASAGMNRTGPAPRGAAHDRTGGWIVGGGADLADWLHRRLGGYVAYGPAADRQFGNVLLSRWPLTDTQRVELPQGRRHPGPLDAVRVRHHPALGGDLNSTPTSDEIATITEAGYTSAVDEVGDPAAMTQPSDAPDRRIDWIFGRGVRFVEAEVLADEQSSDHLPVLATLVP